MKKWDALELVNVEFENDNKKAVLTFLNEEEGTILEVNFNKQGFENGKFVDSGEKAAKVDEWCKEYFNLDFDKLAQAIGTKKAVYQYDKFNALWESQQIEKYDKDMVGTILEVEVSECFVDDTAIRIRWIDDGKTYESKMTFATYMEERKEWFTNPQRKQKQEDKFLDYFGIPVERCGELVGQTLMVEIKLAFKKFVYCEIKPLAKGKKMK